MVIDFPNKDGTFSRTFLHCTEGLDFKLGTSIRGYKNKTKLKGLRWRKVAHKTLALCLPFVDYKEWLRKGAKIINNLINFPDCMKYAEGERGIRLFFNSKGILRSIDMDSIPEIVNLLDFCEFYADGELMRNEIVKFEKDPTSMKGIDVRLLQRDV